MGTHALVLQSAVYPQYAQVTLTKSRSLLARAFVQVIQSFCALDKVLMQTGRVR